MPAGYSLLVFDLQNIDFVEIYFSCKKMVKKMYEPVIKPVTVYVIYD